VPLSDIATINVTTTGAGVTRAGYGVPLILSHSVSWAERYRTYTSLSAVNEDFDANEPEYLAAEAVFSQTPRVASVVIGRAALQPTQRFSIGVNGAGTYTSYKVRVAVPTGTVFTSQDAEWNSGAGATGWSPSAVWSKGDLVIASDGVGIWSCIGPSQIAYEGGFTGYGGASGPTGTSGNFRENQIYWMYVASGTTGSVPVDAVINGVKSKIEALGAPTAIATGLAGNMVTSLQGSVGSKTLRLLANSAAKFFGVQVYDRAKLSIAQDHSDPGVATDLAAIKNAYNSWYGLITLFNSDAVCNAAAAWVESNTKLYVAGSQNSEIATVAEGSATDVAKDFKGAAYARSFVMHHPSNDEFADAAEMGKFFAIAPGGETWRMKTLAGITVEQYSDTEVTNMKAKYSHFYYDIGGRNVVGGDAKTAAGEYVDTTRGLDWYQSELQADLADLAIGVNKIPFTNQGIALVEAKVRKMNDRGIRAGLIASDPEPTVTVPDAADVASSDKAARELPDVESEWTLAGAIHHITVSVTANV
jgi:hypothetical protein